MTADPSRRSGAIDVPADALAALRSITSEGADWFERSHHEAALAVEPVLLELARLRIATLFRDTGEMARRNAVARAAGLTDDKVAELVRWHRSPLFDEPERACLAFVEQFVIDVSAITAEQVGAVLAHLDPDACFGFVCAVYLLDQDQRLRLMFETLGDDLEA